jgi:hypothetical protein
VSRRAARVAALALSTLACTSVPRAVPLPPGDTRPTALLAELAARGDARQALRAVAKVALEGPSGSARSRQILVAARPARLRVEVQGLLGQLSAVLVSDGERFELFRAGDRSVERGVVHPALLFEVAGIPLAPAEAVGVLLGAPELGGPAHAGGAALRADGELEVELLDPGGAPLGRAAFDAAANLRRLELRAGEGRPAWSARWDEYRPVGDALFAHALAVEFPAAGARAEVSFQHVELNPVLPPGIFALGLAPDGERG